MLRLLSTFLIRFASSLIKSLEEKLGFADCNTLIRDRLMQVFCNQSGGKYYDGRGKAVSREIVAVWQDYLLELA